MIEITITIEDHAGPPRQVTLNLVQKGTGAQPEECRLAANVREAFKGVIVRLSHECKETQIVERRGE